MKKSLFNEKDLHEIKERIGCLTQNSQRKWGRMDVAQMLFHCDKILQVSFGKVILRRKNIIIRTIGIVTMKEMRILNNGIPHNMPTFREVKVAHKCSFEDCRKNLLVTIDEFIKKSKNNGLVHHHELFGEMKLEDWGFMEYKHLHHHLNQFGV